MKGRLEAELARMPPLRLPNDGAFLGKIALGSGLAAIPVFFLGTGVELLGTGVCGIGGVILASYVIVFGSLLHKNS